MRVLLAPDKFRGTFTAAEVCRHVTGGMMTVDPRTVIEPLPLADGGEGTLEVLLGALGGTRHTMKVRGPAGDEVAAAYGVTHGGVAVLESALLCGLGLVPPLQRDPLTATSYGLGQAIASLLDAGVSRFLIGLGGTATVDGGQGMARALGYRFAAPDVVDDTLAHHGLARARFTILCDVDNPPLGPDGAVAVFAPQKGALPAALPLLEGRLAALVEGCAGWKRLPGADLGRLPMGGAGGGLGLGCAMFLSGVLEPGAAFIMDRLGFAARLGAADLLVTGEGSFDIQSRRGKAAHAAVGVAHAIKRATAVIAGRWDGSMPEPHPRRFRVFTAEDSGGQAGILDAGGLARLGAEALRWGAIQGFSTG